MKTTAPTPKSKLDWEYVLLVTLTVLGVLIVLGMLISIPIYFFLAIPDQLADNSIRNRILASIEENPFNQFYEYAIAKNVY